MQKLLRSLLRLVIEFFLLVMLPIGSLLRGVLVGDLGLLHLEVTLSCTRKICPVGVSFICLRKICPTQIYMRNHRVQTPEPQQTLSILRQPLLYLWEPGIGDLEFEYGWPLWCSRIMKFFKIVRSYSFIVGLPSFLGAFDGTCWASSSIY